MDKIEGISIRISALLLVSISSAIAQIPTNSIVELTRNSHHPPTQVQGKTLIFIPQKENQIEKTRAQERTKKMAPLNLVQRKGLNRILDEANSFTDEILLLARDLRAPRSTPEIKMEDSPSDQQPAKRARRAMKSIPKFKDTVRIPRAKKEVDPRYLAPTSPYVKRTLSGAIPGSKRDTRLQAHDQNNLNPDGQRGRSIPGRVGNPDKPSAPLHKSEVEMEGNIRNQFTQKIPSIFRRRPTKQGTIGPETSYRRVSEGLELVHHKTLELNPLSDLKPNDPGLTEIRRTPAGFMDLPESVFQEGNPRAKEPEEFEPGYKYPPSKAAKLPTFTRRLQVVSRRKSSRKFSERTQTQRKRVTTASRRKTRRPLAIF